MKSVFTLLCLVVLAAVTGCSAETQQPEQTPGPQAAGNVVYVDVRTPEEYAEGHVEGSILIPHDQMEARWKELEQHKDEPIVLYCRSGRRSQIALDILKEKGFTKLKNGGGFDDLARQGVPTAK